MAITVKEVVDLMSKFHEVVMMQKGDGKAQSKFFLHPEPRIIILHGKDITLQENYEIHQDLEDEVHIPQKEWELTPLCAEPERARCVGAVYWEGRQKGTRGFLNASSERIGLCNA